MKMPSVFECRNNNFTKTKFLALHYAELGAFIL